MKSKTKFTLILLVASSVVTFSISKNAFDLIVAPAISASVALLFSILVMVMPSRRTGEEFHSQFNYSFLVVAILLAVTQLMKG
jgi:hypothetical protein